MKKIILFNPANGTLNSGDYIIEYFLKKEMCFLFNDATIAEFGTHLPIAHRYQNIKKNVTRMACDSANYKFICGTNIIKKSLIRISPDWSITPCSIPYYKDSIAIGVGLDSNAKKSNIYTKKIYKKIFSKKYIHSVRDESTKRYLEKLGFRAINTGCPTFWGLTADLCKEIPVSKHRNVIFTLTDYCRNANKDKELIDILKKEYENLYFWVQGYQDLEYLESLIDVSDINIIGHSFDEYKKFLENCTDFDYVGTRLHAGIFAMHHKIRTIIISIDNRTIDMKETYNLPLINRENIDSNLSKLINSNFKTEISVPFDEIERWKEQFKLYEEK